MELADLIAVVEERRPSDPLRGIQEATALAEELSDLSDRLIGYYVERARAAGVSWSEIGAMIGVSRQAAQQRFSSRLATLGLADLERAGALQRFTARARDALTRAEGHAGRLRHSHVQPEHLLLAILDDKESLGARAIKRLGGRAPALRQAVAQDFPPGERPGDPIPVDAAARRALTNALAAALQLNHNYIGTEHLLLGLVQDQESWVARTLGVPAADVRHCVVELLNEYLQRRG